MMLSWPTSTVWSWPATIWESPGARLPGTRAADALQEALVYQGMVPLRFTLDEAITDLLVAGNNLFAVEVHNENPASSDLSSNPYLHAGVGVSGNYFHTTPDWFYPPFTEDSTLLPLMLIDTEGQTIPNEPRIIARMKLIDNRPGGYYNKTSRLTPQTDTTDRSPSK